MASSAATTIEAYLAALPEPQRALAAEVVALVRAHVPPGYEEAMAWGMPTWQVPLSRYPDTYNGKPLAYVSFAAQKAHYALYLMMAYTDSAQDLALRDAYAKAGVKLDMGKSCLRFKRADQLLHAPVAAVIASTPVDAFIAMHEAAHRAKRG